MAAKNKARQSKPAPSKAGRSPQKAGEASDSASVAEAPSGDISWKDAPYIVASGICMGTADVVPGVSGGTMAVAMGIYGRLLAALASIDTKLIGALFKLRLREVFSRLHWRFLVTLLGGIGLAIIVMVKIVKLPDLLTSHRTQVYAVFFGLVAASAVVLGRKIQWSGARALSGVLGVAFGFGVVNLVPLDTPTHPAFIFFAGFIAISAMLLPGISGSFLLLIMGKYEYILTAVSEFRFGVIIPFALGCLSGVVTFSRVVGWMMRRWEHGVTAFLTGLLVGSLWRIWPYQNLETIIVREKERVIGAKPFLPEQFELSVIALTICGFVAVVAVERYAAGRARHQEKTND